MDGNETVGDEFSFEGENASSMNQFAPNTVMPKLVAWVMKTGWVKTREQADWVLLSIAIVAVVVAALLFIVSTSTPRGHDQLDRFAHPGIVPR